MSELLKEIEGFTWPGIEFGTAPSPKYSFYEYIDALRLGNLERFKDIETESGDWWFPTLDRGAGAALHFAADHGQLEVARFLLEKRAAKVNQADAKWGWTPLHRAARVAHYGHAHGLALFELLLQHGADAGLLTFAGAADPITVQLKIGSWANDPVSLALVQGEPGPALSVIDVAVTKGHGWAPGRLRQVLQDLIDKHASVPKPAAFTYRGPLIGPTAAVVLKAWQDSPAALACKAPEHWRPPPPAGFLDAAGMRRVDEEAWRPAGQDDGSVFLRQMDDAELAAQAQLMAAI